VVHPLQGGGSFLSTAEMDPVFPNHPAALVLPPAIVPVPPAAGSGFFQANPFFLDHPVAPVLVPPAAGSGVFYAGPFFPDHPAAWVLAAAGRGIFPGVAPGVAQAALVPPPSAAIVPVLPAAIVPVHANGKATVA